MYSLLLLKSSADVWPIANDNSKDRVKLGRYAGMNGSVHNNVRELFYLDAGLSPNTRWTHNPLPEAYKLVEQVPYPDGDYVFIHHEPEPRGYVIRPGYFTVPNIQADIKDVGLSILRYAEAMIHANEIHVIDSAFLHLAESLPIKGKVFLHSYARP